MGYTPAEVDQMSMWEFECCFDGYARANGIKTGKVDITDDQYQQLVDLGERWNREADGR